MSWEASLERILACKSSQELEKSLLAASVLFPSEFLALELALAQEWECVPESEADQAAARSATIVLQQVVQDLRSRLKGQL